jgi:hypothetical protein
LLISPGQLWSLRDDPQTSSTRERERRFFCVRSAFRIAARVASHSIARSKPGSSKPRPALRVRGLFRYSR